MRHLIIDGYSLLHRDPEFAPVHGATVSLAREKLIRKIDRLAGALASRVDLVFDGRAEGSRNRVDATSLHVTFSPRDKTADTVIEQLVHEDSDPAGVCVVTSDRRERETVTAAGAQAMSCAAFLELFARTERQFDRSSRPARESGANFTLGDLF